MKMRHFRVGMMLKMARALVTNPLQGAPVLAGKRLVMNSRQETSLLKDL